MLPMCNNEKWKCKICDVQKNDINFFVQRKNEIRFIFWHLVIFLMLCNNKNISPWHNSFKSRKQKISVAEKNFMFKKKLMLHKN